ncbi:hypothetical protein [Achromobacter anxifer]|uniref:hypothetical protein n=1 Tax=Achromobacter anxifer TaxID=1287737 RepID=UPI00155BE16B|nr:hypothetical protein [Achromobacter anxifer]MDF8364514.1 hypothetical protein [Achromobacter anxifer]CAB5517426.1 hypothetical protein LMG26857_06521 [Achromobacter anxifer]
MKYYVYVVSGVAAELIDPFVDVDGNEVSIEDRFHPDFAAKMIEVTSFTGIAIGDVYDGEGFSKPSPAAPPVPEVVSRFQARAALLQAGVLDDVTMAMQGPGIDPLMKMAWEEAQEFRRASPTVATMAESFGWDAQYVDALFVAAASIEA